MVSKKTGKTLFGARIPKENRESLPITSVINQETKIPSSVMLRFKEQVPDLEFSELDFLSITPDKSVVYCWNAEKPAKLSL
jgi:hypothetical protein